MAQCPKCKKEARCSRTEVGPWDAYVGSYTLHCAMCGHKEEKQIHEGYTACETDPPICPFCNTEHSQEETQSNDKMPKNQKA